MLAPNGFLDVGGHRLEYRHVGPDPSLAPTLVLLHEGLGCVALWGKFLEALNAATGLGVFAYSRAGYGRSSPVRLPRPLTYMHDEAAQVLPGVLDAIGLRSAVLVGHSDGGSIAAIYAGTHQDRRVRGLVLIAPHFFVEDVALTAIAAARVAYEKTDLRLKLSRWHHDVDVAFRGWNDAWLDAAFRDWDISDCLRYIKVRIQVIQGAVDQYGTLRQIEVAEAACTCPVDVTVLPAIAHAPHREAMAETVAIIAAFAAQALVA